MSEFQVHNTAECSDGPKSGGIVLKEFIVRWDYNGDGKILITLNDSDDKLIQSVEHVKSRV